MTNSISTLYSSPSLDKATLEKSKRKALEPASDNQTETGKAAKSAGKDEVVLSDIAKRAMAEPAFDRTKVDAIKQAIQDGNYPLNARRIAESFVAIEKMIGK
jgi:negative regulator of flagellin synthesis FlgM